MIKIYNRKTKQYDIEKVAGGRLLDVLYSNKIGRLSLELLIKRKIYSALTGFFFDTQLSKRSIKKFAESFSIDLAESIKTLGEFSSFNDFFARQLKSDAREFNTPDEMLISPGDGRLQAWEHIDYKRVIQIKGMDYSLAELLQDEKLAGEYQDGTYIILRLCPVDYHRFHFIDSGFCSEPRKIKGEYYSVNPVALSKIPEVFCRNKREYCIFKTDNFGDVIYVEVGATSVGSIIQTYGSDRKIRKGEEKGYFKFGGSTVLLFFKKDMVRIDNDILKQTEMGIETKVAAGEIIGRRFTE